MLSLKVFTRCKLEQFHRKAMTHFVLTGSFCPEFHLEQLQSACEFQNSP
jgi:hypothetical protein